MSGLQPYRPQNNLEAVATKTLQALNGTYLDKVVAPPPPAKTPMQRVGHVAAAIGYGLAIPFAATGFSFIPNLVIAGGGAAASLSADTAVAGQGRKAALVGGAGLVGDGAQAALHFVPIVGSVASAAVGCATSVPFYWSAMMSSIRAARG